MIGQQQQEGPEGGVSRPARPGELILMVKEIDRRRLLSGGKIKAVYASTSIEENRDRSNGKQASDLHSERRPPDPIIPYRRDCRELTDTLNVLAIKGLQVVRKIATKRVSDMPDDPHRVVSAISSQHSKLIYASSCLGDRHCRSGSFCCTAYELPELQEQIKNIYGAITAKCSVARPYACGPEPPPGMGCP